MPQTSLPFPDQEVNLDPEHLLQCQFFSLLSEPFKEAVQSQNHLLAYLHLVPVGEVGIPDYYSKLSRDLRTLKERNLIYPVSDQVFTHIYTDPSSAAGRDLYISVEPTLTLNMEPLMLRVERRLIDMVEEVGRAETDEEKAEVLLSCIDRICIAGNGSASRPRWFGRRNGDKIQVTPLELDAIKYLILRDKIGMGVLQPLLLDRYIEDISCSGVGHVFVEHKIFRSVQSALVFSSLDELDEFVIRLGERIRKPVTVRDPIVDATLPDGSRINIVYGRDVSKRGSNFTIRKFSDTPYSILQLIEWGTMDYLMAAYLSLVIEEGMNLFVSGETASGKTTTLNALTTFIPPDAKIVSIEDTPELKVPHTNWIREVTKGGMKASEGDTAAIDMFDLLKAGLRQRPDSIIVGEIRGAEGAIAFGAMQTGHAVMSTFHAGSVPKLIQRITGNPINVPKSYMDNLNIVIIQTSVRLPDGTLGRRVVTINELVGYDRSSDTFSWVEMFRWNSATDTFAFPGDLKSYILEQKICIKRGIPHHKKRTIYAQLRRRARILERLHKERGITDFYELLQVLAEAQRAGVF